MNQRIIITTGYMGSGSSAATDLIAEYKDCQNEMKSHEYVFLSCPNGLFDLEDKLRYGNNAFRSDEALRTFEKLMSDLYDKKFWWVGNYKVTAGNEFQKYYQEFLNEITTYDFPGYWYWNEYPDAKMITKLVLVKPFKILFHRIHEFKKITRYDDRMRIAFFRPELFYPAAKKFIYQIIGMIAKNKPNVILDQLLLPFNLYRVDDYFDDDTYVIVVERDPRDVFLLNKYIWTKKGITVPMPMDVHMFCKFYRDMRESEHPCTSKKVLRVRFEDLVYRYEESVERIQNHLGFKAQDHILKKQRFDPALSIKNTQLFHNPKYQEEVKVIEEELQEYLYDFPYTVENFLENSIEFE